MKRMIINLFATLLRRNGDNDQGEYQMTTVTLQNPIPAIHDLSKVNISVSGR